MDTDIQCCFNSPAIGFLSPVVSHRMVLVGRDVKDEFIPTPCHGQGHLSPDQAAQSHIQPGLERVQGWGTHNFTGKAVPELRPPRKSKVTEFTEPRKTIKPRLLATYIPGEP